MENTYKTAALNPDICSYLVVRKQPGAGVLIGEVTTQSKPQSPLAQRIENAIINPAVLALS